MLDSTIRMKKNSSLRLFHALLVLVSHPVFAQVWINEFHYDNTGTDVGEFIELGHTIALDNVVLYYVLNPTPSDSSLPVDSEINLRGLLPSSTVNGISYTVVPMPNSGLAALPNNPGGFLLGLNYRFGPVLSFEGPLVAMDESSVDIGVSEGETTPVGYSLQKCPESNRWVGPLPNTKGGPNKKCNSASPSAEPSSKPTSLATETPSVQPSPSPTETPSLRPSQKPSVQPSVAPTAIPSVAPSPAPSAHPSGAPTEIPSYQPSQEPSYYPSANPTRLCPFEWHVYHSRNNKKVGTIVDGGTIRNPPPCRFINIEAVPLCGVDTTGVTLELYQGTTLIERRTELKAPYFLFGNLGADVWDGSIPAGTYTIRAIVNDGISPSTTFTLGGKCGK